MIEAELSNRPDAAGPTREADNPRSLVVRFGRDKPLKLDAGVELSPFQIAYQTYGTLNASCSNAVLVCQNVLGACMGTSGPASTNPDTGKPWGLEFPVITVRDMVRAQAMLLDHLGIASLFSMAGGSMGGMQVLQWCASYPQRVFSALPIATSTRPSARKI